MNDALYIAATGMQMQQRNVDTIANNLANVNTQGFKKARVTFADLVSHGTQSTVGNSGAKWHGLGVNISSLTQVFTAGVLKETDAQLDVAIRGDGFFEVQSGDGNVAYSRGGTLTVDRDGFLATSDGHQLKPAMHVGTDIKTITIAADGQVTVQRADATQAIEVGRLDLVRFADNSGLSALGGNLFQSTEQSGEPIAGKAGDAGLGTLAQGYTEASNVNLVNEMVDLMVAQRAYESNSKVIQAADEMLAMGNSLRK